MHFEAEMYMGNQIFTDFLQIETPYFGEYANYMKLVLDDQKEFFKDFWPCLWYDRLLIATYSKVVGNSSANSWSVWWYRLHAKPSCS